MPNREHYVKCFLAGGLALGILSGIPGIGGANLCCCMWVILGGGLAGYLLVHWSSYQVSEGEGALVGLLSGIFGSIITSIIFALQQLLFPQDYSEIWQEMSGEFGQIPPELLEGIEQGMELMTNPVFQLTMILLVLLVAFSVFGMIGGLIAVAIWGPRKFPPHGQPPAYYPPGTPPPPSVYIPPPVMPQQPPPTVPPESNRFPGSGRGPSGPV